MSSIVVDSVDSSLTQYEICLKEYKGLFLCVLTYSKSHDRTYSFKITYSTSATTTTTSAP